MEKNVNLTLKPNTSNDPVRFVSISRAYRPLVTLLGLFAIISFLYSVTTPIFEAPDEKDHFRYINWLADGNEIPHIIEDLAIVGHEIGQPPLYYATVALFVAPIDRSDLETIAEDNPYWRKGAGPNVHYHTGAERFPYKKSTLAVHVARLASIGMGMITIVSTYFIARHLIPKHALWAAAFVAFTPQFAFLSGIINNDNLIITLSSLTLLVLVGIVQIPHFSIWRYLLLGILWGGAILAKLSGIALGGVIVLGLLAVAWKEKSWLRLWAGLPIISIGLLSVSGWWFWRNWNLYGHPLAWEALITANAGLVRAEALSWWKALRVSTYLHQSYWALFGYGIPAPTIFYWFANGIAALAVIGIVIRVWQRKTPQPAIIIIGILTGWLLIMTAALLNWIRQLAATEQGRLIFPAIASITILFVWGLSALPYQQWIKRITLGGLGIWAAVLPLMVIVPAFATPSLLSPSIVVPNSQHVEFGSGIWLRGFEVENRSIESGQSLVIDLYWQAAQPIDESYTVSVHAVDAAGRAVAKLDTIPYNGRFPTPVWPQGQTFRDSYTLPPLAETAVPGQGSIIVKLYPWRQTEKMLPIAIDGNQIGTTLLLTEFKIKPVDDTVYQPSFTTNVTFGNTARLIGYDASSTAANDIIPITLYWESIAADPIDYTVFVHLLDTNGNLVAQADSLPQNGRFPTSIWEAGEIIADEHQFHLPEKLQAGEYAVIIGLYNPQNGARLQAQSDGNRVLNDAVSILSLTIKP